MNKIFASSVATLALSTVAIAPVSASVYANASDSTRIALHEKVSGDSPITGEYSTRIGSQTWIGSVNVTGQGSVGSYRYTGTFSDFLTGPGSADSRSTCTGNIKMTRRAVGRSTQLSLSIEWTVTGGNNCPSVGQTFNLNLVEPYPVADRNGDFTNISGWNGGTQDSSWGSWQVVDTTLNCRATPNGEIQKTYSQNTMLLAKIERSGSALVSAPSTGAPWLRTQDNCYVRANSRYIAPASWLEAQFAR